MSVEPTAKLIQPNAQNQYTVSTADLPLSCPMPHPWGVLRLLSYRYCL